MVIIGVSLWSCVFFFFFLFCLFWWAWNQEKSFLLWPGFCFCIDATFTIKRNAFCPVILMSKLTRSPDRKISNDFTCQWNCQRRNLKSVQVNSHSLDPNIHAHSRLGDIIPIIPIISHNIINIERPIQYICAWLPGLKIHYERNINIKGVYIIVYWITLFGFQLCSGLGDQWPKILIVQ